MPSWRAGSAAAFVAVLALVAVSCDTGARSRPLPEISADAAIALSSTSFEPGAPLPAEHTCDGVGLAPRLTWSEPDRVEEFVLLMTDSDAPSGTAVHWLVYAIPSNADSIGEGQGPSGARQGRNDFGHSGYASPCPPPADDPHRYVFTLYGLSESRTASIPPGASAGDVLEAIACCVASVGRLTGTYRR